MPMGRVALLLLGVLAGAAEAHPHPGGTGAAEMRPPPMMAPPHRMEQDYARQAMRAGEIRPLRDIAGQWRGAMPGYDFIGSPERKKAFATPLTPARDAGGDPDKRWDPRRNAVFNEILGFYGLPYWYAWQVTILGLGPI